MPADAFAPTPQEERAAVVAWLEWAALNQEPVDGVAVRGLLRGLASLVRQGEHHRPRPAPKYPDPAQPDAPVLVPDEGRVVGVEARADNGTPLTAVVDQAGRVTVEAHVDAGTGPAEPAPTVARTPDLAATVDTLIVAGDDIGALRAVRASGESDCGLPAAFAYVKERRRTMKMPTCQKPLLPAVRSIEAAPSARMVRALERISRTGRSSAFAQLDALARRGWVDYYWRSDEEAWTLGLTIAGLQALGRYEHLLPPDDPDPVPQPDPVGV